MAGLQETDIKLDALMQPIKATSGEALLISNSACFLQDLKLEAMSQVGDLFYAPDYGWSLLDFMQAEYSEFLALEITQRVKSKLAGKLEIEQNSTDVTVKFLDDIITIVIKFKTVDNDALSLIVDINRLDNEVTAND